MNKYYLKVLGHGRYPLHPRAKIHGPWPPIGEWTPRISPVEICHRGYHVYSMRGLYDALGMSKWLKNLMYTYFYLAKIHRAIEPNIHGKVVAEQAMLVKYLGKMTEVETLQERAKLRKDVFRCEQRSKIINFFKNKWGVELYK